MAISNSDRKYVKDRASECCEYCRIPASASTVPFHVDHFIPRKHGGDDDLNNLCLACFNCNLHKSHDLTGIDPDTNQITPLYNPRQHNWSEHFEIDPTSYINGLTPKGRTTIRVLQINTPERIEFRVVLTALKNYPCGE